jgi:ribosomal protein L15
MVEGRGMERGKGEGEGKRGGIGGKGFAGKGRYVATPVFYPGRWVLQRLMRKLGRIVFGDGDFNEKMMPEVEYDLLVA